MSFNDEVDFDFKEESKYELKQYEKWEEFGLKEDLQRGIYAMGFETPSFIQKIAIMPIIQKRDIRAQSQSGTGKTGAFIIGSLQRVDSSVQTTQVLVIVSTREIAAQNAKVFKGFAKFMDVKISLVLGGSSQQENQEELKQNPHVVVGTPGRINQMIKEGFLNTEHIKLLVIDEADEMLQAGFQDDVKFIFNHLNKSAVQVAMFSATYEEEELLISQELLRDPIVIDLRKNEQTLTGIKQYYIDLGEDESPKRDDLTKKLIVLVDLLKNYQFGQTVIFITSKDKARYIYNGLTAVKIPCELISSELSQSERVEVLERFKSGTNRILISSGLLSRGVDVQNLSVVFCLDVPPPQRRTLYIHRIGRSGRYGKKGMAIMILHAHEMKALLEIEKYYSTKIKPFATEYLEPAINKDGN